jgi:hypothetical protein
MEMNNSSQRSPNSFIAADDDDDDDDISACNGACQTDDESFVCLSVGKVSSAPNSVRSSGMKSIDSIVMVEAISSATLSDFS